MTTHAMTTLPMSGARSTIARALDVLGRFPLPLLQLMFRLAVASVFLKAGLIKIRSWETTVQLFADEYKVPVLSPDHAATMAATFEIGCATLLILGLGTRLATLPLLGMIAVIQTFVYPNTYAEHLTCASIFLILLPPGGSTYSPDKTPGPRPAAP